MARQLKRVSWRGDDQASHKAPHKASQRSNISQAQVLGEAKTPEKLKVADFGRRNYMYSTIPRNREETTSTVTPTEDFQTQTHFDRVSSPGRSADMQISRSSLKQTESKRLDYCSRCYEGEYNVKASGIFRGGGDLG